MESIVASPFQLQTCLLSWIWWKINSRGLEDFYFGCFSQNGNFKAARSPEHFANGRFFYSSISIEIWRRKKDNGALVAKLTPPWIATNVDVMRKIGWMRVLFPATYGTFFMLHINRGQEIISIFALKSDKLITEATLPFTVCTR